jgi:site-specific recombinase XerC
MASIFKRKRKVKLANGKIVVKQSQKYYTKLIDANGIKRTIPLYTDKTASMSRALRLQTEYEQVKEGIVDQFKKHRKRSLLEHLENFKQYLLDKGNTADYANLTHNRIKAILTACKFVFIADVQPSRVQRYIAERKREGLSIKSCNYYLTAAKSFLNWMVADRRIAENPLAHLKGQNAKKDIRRQRRALTQDEITALLTATLKGQKHYNLTGKQRYMLYTLAMSTGFRAKELHSMTWRSLNLNDSEPSVTVLAGYAKNGKEATLPLRKDIAELFEQWFNDNEFSQDDKVFPKFNKSKGADMLKRDLEDAGIPYQDESGRYADFHAQRHTFISNVGKSGATVKEAQRLARHSTSALTLDVYTHIGLHDERRAIEKLPQLHNTDEKKLEKTREVALKTGTDGKPVEATQNGSKKLTPKWTPFLTPTAYSGCDRSAMIGTEQDNLQENPENSNCLNNGELDNENNQLATIGTGKNEMGRGGFEPPTHGFSVRCSTN